MNGLAEVISLEARRNRLNRRDPRADKPAALATPAARLRRLAVFCVGLLTLVAGLMLVDQSALPHSPQSSAALLPDSLRQGLYQRTVDDLTAGCATAQAHSGILRQHCVDQAKFLSALPECTGDCSRLTDAVLKPRR
jgi:hypothetical protein